MELFEKFKKMAEATGAVVEVIKTDKKQLADAINKAIASAENIVYAPPVDLNAGLFDDFLSGRQVNTAWCGLPSSRLFQ